MSAKTYHIVGQHEVRERLARQLAEGRVAHAQLFCGPEGCGKLPIALEFARALLCHQPTEGHACGTCASCKMTAGLVHPDLHFVFPVIKPAGSSGEVTSDTYLKEWREQLQRSPYFSRQDWLADMGVQNQQSQIPVAESDNILRKLSLTAAQGGYRVVIVWLPEQMNAQAANKLLKLIEEPPTQTVFLLVSDRPEHLLATILSRTQRINIPPIPTDDLAAELVENCGLQPEDARLIARQSAGNFTEALQKITVNADAELYFDLFVMLMRLSYRRDVRGIKKWADEVAEWGRERQKAFLTYCLHLVRENFMYNFRQEELTYMSSNESEFAVRFARFINERNVIGIMQEMEAALRDIGQNVNPKMVFFSFALRIIVLLL